MAKNVVLQKIDWLSILLYLALVGIGWLNIYSTTHVHENSALFNLDQPYGKQLIFICLSVLLIIFVLSIEAKFYERFASIFYLSSIVLLAGLFLFGKNINGATAWYSIGPFTLQPSEFAKVATALAVSKYLSDIQTNIKLFSDQLRLFAILAIPALLIILQPDPGSTVVYASFFFVMYREGLPAAYLVVGTLLTIIFISTLKFGLVLTILTSFILGALYYYLRKKRAKKVSIFPIIAMVLLCGLVSFSTNMVYENVFKRHHRDRFSLWLRLDNEITNNDQLKRTVGYNTHQSETAIGSGGILGKGFMEGTRTKGNFVPEQDTDYIFTTLGEEWGFIGTSLVVLLFTALLLRLLYLAERQKSQFSRIYGYSVVSILFFHFMINIGMVIGLLPTIGIPLPFFSYGGSGLWGFTILLFIFLKFDANRINDWMER